MSREAMDGGFAAAEGPPDEPLPALAALTHALERLVSRNDPIVAAASLSPSPEPRRGVAAFQAARPPSIGVGKYLDRIHRYARCSPSCFVVGYVYIDRMAHRHPGALIGSLNVHRLILTSVMLASKVLDDLHHSNAFYAKVGGVSNAELNILELELLFLLDFRVMVNSRVFESYCVHLEKEMMLNGVKQKIERTISDPLDDEIEGLAGGHDSNPPLVFVSN